MKKWAIWQRGVTLIEMMLVIIIISLIMLSIIQYADHQRDLAVAEDFGVKLYTYGQAVRSYLLDNQAQVRGTPQGVISGQSADGNCMYTFKGMDWLKTNPTAGGQPANPNPHPGESYLPDNFTFNSGMHPLYAGPTEGDVDKDIVTEVGLVGTSPCDKTGKLMVKVIVPILYKTIDGKPVAMPDITVTAARFANQYYSSTNGGAAFEYTYAIPTGAPPASGGTIFDNTFLVGMLTSTAAQEDYLRVDGQNYMKQSIVLYDENHDEVPYAAPTDQHARNLLGVEHIYFDTTVADAPTGITGIDVILFDNISSGQSKVIEGLDSIKFSTADATTISSLDTIMFTGEGSAITQLQGITMLPATIGRSYISNINVLTFAGDGTAATAPEINFLTGDGVISGLKTVFFSGTDSTLEGVDTIIFNSGDKMSQLHIASGYSTSDDTGDVPMIPVGKGFCYLTKVSTPAGTSGNPPRCEVLAFSGTWKLLQDAGGACEAMCIQWMP